MMKVTLNYAGIELGTVRTNRGLNVMEALDILGINMDEYAAAEGWDGWDFAELEMVYE